MIRIYDWLQNPPFNFYKWSLVSAGLICIVTSGLFWLLKYYNLWDDIYVIPGYSVRNYIFETGQELPALFVWIAAKRLISSDVWAKVILTFFVDLACVDVWFLFTSNPYEISVAKGYTVLISFIIFILHCLLFNMKQIKKIFR